MADSFYVGAYWGPRAESAAECADKLADCLERLRMAHPVLSTWHRLGKSKAAASRHPVDVDRDTLESLLVAGRNRTDIGHEVIAELGYRVSLWNNNPFTAAFSVGCGRTTPLVPNVFLLDLPAPEDPPAGLYDAAVAHRILMSVVETWQPRWATFTSRGMRERQDTKPSSPVGGWQTFVAAAYPGPAPREVIVGEVTGGILITAGEDPLHVSDTQLSAVAEYLEKLTIQDS